MILTSCEPFARIIPLRINSPRFGGSSPDRSAPSALIITKSTMKRLVNGLLALATVQIRR